MDVDSTLIKQEVIDLLAIHAGVGAQVSAITELAMQGGLDFSSSLARRVSLLKGLSESALSAVRQSIELSNGARTLISTLHAHDIKVGVVSGGFLNVISPLADELKLNFVRANTLEIVDGFLTGSTVGPIIDRSAKAHALREFAESYGISLDETVAAGDGANDLDMLDQAGLGIAFMAKPKVQAAADVSITNGRLDQILQYFDIAREDWVLVED